MAAAHGKADKFKKWNEVASKKSEISKSNQEDIDSPRNSRHIFRLLKSCSEKHDAHAVVEEFAKKYNLGVKEKQSVLSQYIKKQSTINPKLARMNENLRNSSKKKKGGELPKESDSFRTESSIKTNWN